MLSQDIIDPAQTKLAASMVIASQKDGTICLGVEYRKLGNLRQCDMYLVLRMDECIQ